MHRTCSGRREVKICRKVNHFLLPPDLVFRARVSCLRLCLWLTACNTFYSRNVCSFVDYVIFFNEEGKAENPRKTSI